MSCAKSFRGVQVQPARHPRTRASPISTRGVTFVTRKITRAAARTRRGGQDLSLPNGLLYFGASRRESVATIRIGGQVGVAGKSVLITGGTGFLGTHVAKQLEGAGARVFPVGHRDYDLRRRDETDRMLRELRPDAVIHLAAVVGGIGANKPRPGRFFYENAIMGIELLEACRVANVAKVVVAGTVCAYPKFAPIPFREDDLWNGYPEETNAPYGLAKKMLLVQAQAYRDEYGMNAICLFPVNLYGPGDNFDVETGHVIPGMIRKFVEAREAGDVRRPLGVTAAPLASFSTSLMRLELSDLALESYDGADPVNLGSGEEISIRDLAERVREAVGFTGTIEWDASRPNGQPRRKLDTSRAQERFGFRAETTFRGGLKETIEWYRAHGAIARMRRDPEPPPAEGAPSERRDFLSSVPSPRPSNGSSLALISPCSCGVSPPTFRSRPPP